MKTIHISFDDVIDIFRNITIYENKYKNIWDNVFLRRLKELHDSFGAIFSFYVYYENEKFSLSDATGKYMEQFKQNAEWMRFGFHSYSDKSNYCTDYEKLLYEDYSKTINELRRIVGIESIDHTIRIHRFAAGRKAIKHLRGNIYGLLTADDQRLSYELSEEICNNIDTYGLFIDENGIRYIKTDIRLERLNDNGVSTLKRLLKLSTRNHFEIFTHEWCMDNIDIQDRLYQLCHEIWKNENCMFRYMEEKSTLMNVSIPY